MSEENTFRKTHCWYEGDDNLQEIIKKANVGDYIEFMTNNQMGWQLLEVIRVAGENHTVVAKTIYDIMDEINP